MRGPPARVGSTKHLSKTLVRLKTTLGNDIGNGFRGPNFSMLRAKPNATLVVQPIEVAPDRSIVVKKAVSSTWLSSVPLLSLASERLDFERRLQSDLNATLVLLNSAEGRCLHKDFQVVLDPGTGGIYHLDFDRCYGLRDVDYYCPHNLLSVAADLLRRRTGVAMSSLVAELMTAIEPPEYCTGLENGRKTTRRSKTSKTSGTKKTRTKGKKSRETEKAV